MAAFNDIDFSTRADWVLLRDGPVSMVLGQSQLDKQIQILQELGYSSVKLDFGSVNSAEEFHSMAALQLGFPAYYGSNLNAFNDCMVSDIKISEISGGMVLVLSDFDRFWKLDKDYAFQVLDIIAHAAWVHLLFGRRLICLVHVSDPDIKVPPVGATTV